MHVPDYFDLQLLAPRRILTGVGCRAALPGLLAEDGRRRPLVVSDPRLGDSAALRDVLALLATAAGPVPMTSDVPGEPDVHCAEAIAALLQRGQHDCVIAIGGGSVIDAAKGAAVATTNPGHLVDYEGFDRFMVDPLPLYALPTTAGTGSEVTRVTVLGVLDPPRKISIKGARLVPTAALVDSDFLLTVPVRVGAAAATDALTHALEAYLRPASSPVSRALGLRAATMILRVMGAGAAYATPANLADLSVASMLAGLAFGNSDVGPVHCLAESIGAVYHAPHGAANAVFLGPVLHYYGAVVALPLAEVARTVWPDALAGRSAGEATQVLVAAVEGFVAANDVGTLRSVCGGAMDIDRIAALAVTNNSNASGPIPMTQADYRSIIASMG
ncbi:MAG: iron-containing alcohol dehydrogenase [Pseudomonadota bacterium]